MIDVMNRKYVGMVPTMMKSLQATMTKMWWEYYETGESVDAAKIYAEFRENYGPSVWNLAHDELVRYGYLRK